MTPTPTKAEVVTELLRPARDVRPAVTPWLDWDDKVRFAEQLVQTGFLPKAVDTAGKALAIIFAGQEIGIPPMHALRSIHVIQGKPSMSAELMLALFKQRGGRAIWTESTNDRAVLWLRHPNGDEHTEHFEMADAKRAGLVSKDGWRFYPKSMLRARAISAGLRAVAPDIIAGIYDPEELGADVTGDGTVVPPVAAATLDAPDEPDAPPADDPAETEPESGRREVPVSLETFEECRQALAAQDDAEALQAFWRALTARETWAAFSATQQVELTAAKNQAKRRLGLT